MLKVESVYKSYRGAGHWGKREPVLYDVTLAVPDGKNLSLIGESGSGKSTLVRLILGMERPDKGQILWNGQPVFACGSKRKQLYKEIQPVFQDNAGCFNPRWKIKDSLTEPMRNYLGLGGAALEQRSCELLDMVDIPHSVLEKYPHELSGGQQKRICIARAISLKPRFILLDEAVSGLDATVMLKILRLLKRLQGELDCSYFFITHDVRAALFMADTVSVMQSGRIVETVTGAARPESFSHPYSKMLMESICKGEKR